MNRRLPKRHVWACDCQGWSRDERCEALDGEVRDLKARLKACRDYMDSDESWSEKAWAATDLRVKNWRKP